MSHNISGKFNTTQSFASVVAMDIDIDNICQMYKLYEQMYIKHVT